MVQFPVSAPHICEVIKSIRAKHVIEPLDCFFFFLCLAQVILAILLMTRLILETVRGAVEDLIHRPQFDNLILSKQDFMHKGVGME